MNRIANALFRIDQLTLYRVTLPLRKPWKTAYGVQTGRELIFLHFHEAVSNQSGWAEVAPLRDPFYLPEYTQSTFMLLKRYVTTVIGCDFRSPQALLRTFPAIRGNWFTRAAIDIMGWGAWCLATQTPLYAALGGQRKTVRAGLAFSADTSVETVCSRIHEAQSQNVTRVRLKISPATNIKLLHEVRNQFPALEIQLDANGSFVPDTRGLRQLQAIDELGFQLIEQPFPYRDFVSHAKLQACSKTPVALDESIEAVDDLYTAISLNACRCVVIKPGKVGGLSNALRMIEICREHNLSCWIGGMLESEIGNSVNLALASVLDDTWCHDLNPSLSHFPMILSDPELSILSTPYAGMVPSTRPWIGLDVDEAALAPFIQEEYTIAAHH
ncbi:MAG: o-succinylbenzoate synthase [Lentisphaerae bacterium]|nr:MAG: o-succinylbenzoate synthase [Lentisphaerota bacterium]